MILTRRLRIWGSEVRILPSAPMFSMAYVFYWQQRWRYGHTVVTARAVLIYSYDCRPRSCESLPLKTEIQLSNLVKCKKSYTLTGN